MQETTAKGVKLTCKKQCGKRQIHMQKTVRNPLNLHAKKPIVWIQEKNLEPWKSGLNFFNNRLS